MVLRVTKQYIIDSIKKGKRLDSRKLDEIREIKVETGVSVNAEGSAKVTIGNTTVIAGVKMDLATPYPDSPDKGVMTTSGEFSPMGAPEFESGPPQAPEIELSRVVDRGIRESGFIDFKKLCIEEGEKVWMIFLDILVIDHDGNLTDAAGIAAMAALLDARIPALTEEGKVDRKSPLTKEKLPISGPVVPVTVSRINGQLVLDTTADEEEAVDAKITVAVKKDGRISALQQGGSAGFTIDEICEVCKIAQKTAKKTMDKVFKS